MGVDTSTYYEIFRVTSDRGYYPNIEPLWNVINLFAARLGGNFNVLLAVSGLLTLVPVFYSVRKFSPNPGVSLFIYYSAYLYCGSFNVTRQYLALSFVLMSFCYYGQSKLKSLLLIIVAICFHYSSVMFIPAFFFSRVALKRKMAIVLVIASFFIGTLFSAKIVSFVLSIGYSFYAENTDLFRSDSTGLLFVLLMNVLYIGMILMSSNRLLNSKWGKLYLLSVIVLNFVYPLQYGTRIYNVFMIGNVFFYPMLLEQTRVKPRAIAMICVIGFSAAVFFKMILQNANEVYPYVFTIY